MPAFDSILFDFDGVLADTEPVHCACWAEVLAPHFSSPTIYSTGSTIPALMKAYAIVPAPLFGWPGKLGICRREQLSDFTKLKMR